MTSSMRLMPVARCQNGIDGDGEPKGIGLRYALANLVGPKAANDVIGDCLFDTGVIDRARRPRLIGGRRGGLSPFLRLLDVWDQRR